MKHVERFFIEPDVDSDILGILIISDKGEGYLHYINCYSNEKVEINENNKLDIDDIVWRSRQKCNRNGYNLIMY